jgi:hypothetical protein
MSRQTVQFFVDERHQPLKGFLLAIAPGPEQLRDLI